LLKQVLQSLLEGRLVALDRQEEITPLFKKDLLSGLDLSMECIGQHELAGQVQALEHLAGCRDLVTLGLSDHPAQILPLAVGRVDHFHAAVTHLLAIHNDQPILDRAGQAPLPLQ
jgi:hypothetical protein